MSDSMNILIVAGSMDSLRLIERLQANGYKIIVLNMCRQIFDSLMKAKGIRIVAGVSKVRDLGRLIENSKINIIIDESNPFSTVISPVLMDTAKQYKIVYCRFEGKIYDVKSENVIFAKDNAHCVEILNRRDGSILLTIGSSDLEEYAGVKDFEKRLHVKVSPTVASIEKCERLGIPGINIFAMHGAASKDLLTALIAHTQASIIVSRAVSTGNGIEIKIEAAEEKGIPIVLINRPEVLYINKFRTFDEIMSFIKNSALAFAGGEALR